MSRAGPSRPKPDPLPRCSTVAELREKINDHSLFDKLQTAKTGIDNEAMASIVSFFSEWPIAKSHRGTFVEYCDFCETHGYSALPIQPMRVAPFFDYIAMRPKKGDSLLVGPGRIAEIRSALEVMRKALSEQEICPGNDTSVRLVAARLSPQLGGSAIIKAIDAEHRRAYAAQDSLREQRSAMDTKPFEASRAPPMPTRSSRDPTPYVKPEPVDWMPPETPRSRPPRETPRPRPRPSLDAIMAAGQQEPPSNIYSPPAAGTEIVVEKLVDGPAPQCIPGFGSLFV